MIRKKVSVKMYNMIPGFITIGIVFVVCTVVAIIQQIKINKKH